MPVIAVGAPADAAVRVRAVLFRVRGGAHIRASDTRDRSREDGTRRGVSRGRPQRGAQQVVFEVACAVDRATALDAPRVVVSNHVRVVLVAAGIVLGSVAFRVFQRHVAILELPAQRR